MASEPVALSKNAGNAVVSDESITTEVLAAVAVAALPVHDPELPEAFPVSGPEKAVAVSVPVPALYVNPPSVLGARSPVADSQRPTEQLVSVVSATVIVAGTMFAVPSKEVPPIDLAVARAVDVSARPTAIFDVPLKLVPPIVRAVSKAVAVAAFPLASPVRAPIKPVAVIFPVLGL